MNTMRQIAKDEPLMVAWEAFQKTEEFANSTKWASTVELRISDTDGLQVRHPHMQGSMWGLFMAGWKAAAEAICEHSDIVVRSNGVSQCRLCGKDTPL